MDFKMNFSATYFFVINIIFFALSFYMNSLLKKKKKIVGEKNINLNYYEGSYIYKGPNFIYNTIIAMILRAYAHDIVKIEKNIYKNKRGEEKVEFILKDLDESSLDEAEKKLFKTLFSFGEKEVSTRQMDKMRRTEADNYNKKFNDFIYFLEDRMLEKKLFSKEKNTLKIFLAFIIFSLLFFIGVVSVYNEAFVGIISIVFSLYFYASLISSFSKMTELGNKKFREMENLEDNLKAGIINSEEDFLLAIGFGLKKEFIKNIYEKIEIPEKYTLYFDRDFYKTFKTALVGDHLLVRN